MPKRKITNFFSYTGPAPCPKRNKKEWLPQERDTDRSTHRNREGSLVARCTKPNCPHNKFCGQPVSRFSPNNSFRDAAEFREALEACVAAVAAESPVVAVPFAVMGVLSVQVCIFVYVRIYWVVSGGRGCGAVAVRRPRRPLRLHRRRTTPQLPWPLGLWISGKSRRWKS